MEHNPAKKRQRELSRREAVRWGASAALVAWSIPTIVTWTPSPAHAGTPAPGNDEMAAPRDAASTVARPQHELAKTGADFGLLAAAGVTTIAAGAATLRLRRTWSDRASATPITTLPLPPAPERPSHP